MASKTKECRTCKARKSTDLFCKAPTVFGGDGFTKDCKACRAELREQRKASRGGSAEPVASEPDPSVPQLKLGPSLGFHCWMEGTDVVVQQESGTGVAKLWLSHAEIAELSRFSEDQEHLALRPFFFNDTATTES